MGLPRPRRFVSQWGLLGLLAALMLVVAAAGAFSVRFLRLEGEEKLTDTDAVSRAVAAYIEAREAGYVNVLLSYAGRFKFREAIKQKDRAEALVHLRQLNEAFPELDRPFLVDPSGVLWAAYPDAPELYGRRFSDRDWYRGVSREWKPYMSDVIESARDRALVAALVVPVRDLNGELIGIMGSAQRLDTIRQWLETLQIPDGDFYIVDRQGHLVYHRTRTGPAHLRDYAKVPVVQRLLKGEEGAGETDNPVEQQARLTVYRRLPTMGWGLVVYREKNAALVHAWTLVVASGAVGAVLVVALAILGVTAIRSRGRVAEALAMTEERSRALQEARDEADRANRAKSEFLSRMSHELRTPLNSILGFAQLFQHSPLNEDDRENVDQILKGGKHLLGLINEVLDIARIEAGRLPLSPEPVQVHEAVMAAVGLVQPLATHRQITIRVDPTDMNGRYVVSDRQRLQQVLLNLLTNAVKYNRDGGAVQVTCDVSRVGRLRILVQDTGPGIGAEKIKRLFVPFERLGAEQTAIEGTGLGLALSQRLVEAMGGHLDVASTIGEGSLFWIELQETASPLEHPEPTPAVQAANAENGHPGVLLYVEDNLSNVRLLERVLARRPYVKLITAMQGRLGLELARQHRPNLILLDLNLPDLPGAEVLARLRAQPETRDVPVVVLSADATAGQIRRMLADGAMTYLTKPLDVTKLLALIDQVLAGPQEERAPRDGVMIPAATPGLPASSEEGRP